MAYGGNDCRECGPGWCDKHEPVTREIFCVSRHKLKWLSESHAWCHTLGNWESTKVTLWTIYRDRTSESFPAFGNDREQIPGMSMGVQNFDSYQQLNDWFIVNILNQEVG